MVGTLGLEPRMTLVGRFTVSCNGRYATYPKMAEEVGFEPTVNLHPRLISSQVP